MKTPFSKYEILGRVVDAVNTMPVDAPILQMCNVIAGSIYQYLQELEIPTPVTLGKPTVVKVPATDIFDTEHTDDIPAEIKPKKTLPELQMLYSEKPVDLKNNYLGQYSNPCSTSMGKCRQPCVQTELWLFNKKTDELTTIDVEYADIETLRKALDPYVEYAKKHRVPPTWLDKETNEAMDDLMAAAKEVVKQQKRNRMDQYVDLYKAGFKVSQIAREMGISEQGVYAYKHEAKKKGLLP